jgi:hypothetical protein
VGGSPSFANPFEDITGNAAVSKANPFPFTTPKPGAAVNFDALYYGNELSIFNSHYSVPYTYNYNLNIQRAITPTLVAQIGYVGSVSHRLPTWFEGDPITPAGHAACLTNPSCNVASIHGFWPQYTANPVLDPANPQGYPNGTPWYHSIVDQDSEGSSNYNSLQASLIEAPRHGLQFTAAYTYSHSLDDGSGYESSTGSAGRVNNYVPGFKHLNYGDSDFDARQRLALSYVYTLPVVGFLRNSLIAREALAGWGISGITALQTGYPIGFSQSSAASGWCDGYSYFGCPDVPEISTSNIGKLNIRAAGNRLVPLGPFSPEPTGTFGNAGRNFYHGPGFDYTNLALTKIVHFTSNESRYVQLRLEAFNAFNHANFANPSGNIDNQTFGVVTSVVQTSDPNGDPSPARSVQLAGKFYF